MNYRLAYLLGFHPWEDAADDPPFAAKISEMFDLDENGPRASLRPGARHRHGQRDLGNRVSEARLAGDGYRHRRQGPCAWA